MEDHGEMLTVDDFAYFMTRNYVNIEIQVC